MLEPTEDADRTMPCPVAGGVAGAVLRQGFSGKAPKFPAILNDAALPQFAFPGSWEPSISSAVEEDDLAKTVERRPARPNANATQEIDGADVLEVLAIEHHPASVIPVALDVATRHPGDDAATKSERYELPRTHLRWQLGAAALAPVGALVVTMSARSPSGPTVAAASVAAPKAAAVVAPHPATAAADTASASSVPVVSVLSLPRVLPTTGTIRLIEAAAAHRLFIDGVPHPGPSAVVPCGKHMVQVGSAGRAHALIITCGEETVIAR